MSQMIRLLTVDDHRLIHRAMAQMVNAAPDMQIVGEASSGEEALEFIDALQPHVVLMDLEMPGMGGLAATELVRQQFPHVRVIIVSGNVQEPYPSRALAAGARGFVSKESDEAEIERAIRLVVAGRRYITAEVAGNMAESLGGDDSPFGRLSVRELDVALKIVSGHTTQEIGELLHIHTNTVSSFRRRIFDKLDVRNDVELTLAAFRYGLVSEGLHPAKSGE